MLWVKTFHVLCVMAWMTGVFYLPRLFVNLVEAKAAGEPTARLEGMCVRLFRFTTILAAIALVLGMVLWLNYGIDGRWLHWKLVFVLALIVYHVGCGFQIVAMKRDGLKHGSVFYRVFNEVSLLIVVPILIFAIVKPF